MLSRLHAPDPDPREDEAEEQDDDVRSRDREDGVGGEEGDDPSGEDDARSRSIAQMPSGNAGKGCRGVVADVEQERDARRRVAPGVGARSSVARRIKSVAATFPTSNADIENISRPSPASNTGRTLIRIGFCSRATSFGRRLIA